MVSTRPVANHVVRPTFLERASTEYLVPFLRPFEGFLVERGVRLEEAETPDWIECLIDALTAPEANLPSALAQALMDVADLAGSEGVEASFDAPHVRQLDLFRGRSSLTAEDLALHLYVAHGAVFRATRALVAMGGGEAHRFAEYLPSSPRRLNNFEWSQNASNLLNARAGDSSSETAGLTSRCG